MSRDEKIQGVDVNDDIDYSTQDEAIAKTIIAMLNIKEGDLSKMTQINDEKELRQIAVLKTVGSFYGIKMLEDFTGHLLELKISLSRKGREEIKSMITSQMNQMKTNEMGFLSRLRGRL